jgi:hypothetical protein
MRRFGSLVVLAAAAACSAKDAPKADSAKVAQAGASAAPASRGKFDLATHTVTVAAKDFAFEAPDTISAGLTTFHLINDGPSLHHIELVRLDSGKTAADLGAALQKPGPFPAWASLIGGPNSPNPGSTFDATFDVKEGNYVIVCLVDIPDHMPHFAKGMVHPLTVVAAQGTPLVAPTADVTVSLADYAFTVKGDLAAGKHTFKIENAGPQPHELELVRFAPGKTLKDLAAWMDKPQGPPPGDAIGGVSAVPVGSANYVTYDLTPGSYAMLCFIPDAKDGKAHVQHGMVKEFQVK